MPRKSDTQLREEVQKELYWDTLVARPEVAVSVEDGVVRDVSNQVRAGTE